MLFASFLFWTVSCHLVCQSCGALYANRWAVELEDDAAAEHADHIAQIHGFRNLGQIGSLKNHYLFVHENAPKQSSQPSDLHHMLKRSPQIRAMDQLEIKKRVKRDVGPYLDDPEWSQMWYLNRAQLCAGQDMNVFGAWRLGFTGRGVVVTIIDDGIEYTHPDLTSNYDPAASIDINGQDNDPLPRYDASDFNRHGTRCAGEVAASANNSVCGVGVAYNCKIGGVRMLDGDVDDGVEAASLSLNPQHIDIYSSSWGPDDTGAVVDGPGALAKKAFLNGIEKGRNGRGSIFVWASGNGGRYQDSCACDGYANSMYTMSISSVTEHGQKPWYLEECSSTLATTYSSGNSNTGNANDRQIVSTDLHSRCTEQHTGTSASAPLAAGLVALALEANRNLTWRDMQFIVLLTSRADAIADSDWEKNGVGRKVNHKYGYGLMDAGAMVEMAMIWTTVPEQHICFSKPTSQPMMIDPHKKVESKITFPECEGKNEVRYLEHVQAVVTVQSQKRGSLVITLYSPRGTPSILLNQRPSDREGRDGFNEWPFLTARLWGEDPSGEWRLVVEDAEGYAGQLVSWSLVTYGTSVFPVRLRRGEASSITPVFNHEGTLTGITPPPPRSGGACHPECDPSEPPCGPTAHECHKCLHYMLPSRKSHGECVAQCPDGFFPDKPSQTCHSCHPSCLTCVDGDDSACKSCKMGSKLVVALGQCIDICPEGHFLDQENAKCLRCDMKCQSCAGTASNCTSCHDDRQLKANQCLLTKKCADGTFYNNDECSYCDTQCATCVGPYSSNCISCDVGKNLVLQNSACVEQCDPGFFKNESIGMCQRCHPSCQQCSGPLAVQCLACPAGAAPQSGRCVSTTHTQTCPTGQFWNSQQCEACHQSCHTCFERSKAECTSCSGNRFLLLGECVLSCPEQYYGNTGNLSCDSCHHSCLTCSAGGVRDCISCPPNSRLSAGQCVSQCPAGKFLSVGSQCQDCHPSCATCTGPEEKHCAQCIPHFFLYEGTCTMRCPDRWFGEVKYGQCQICHENCSTCGGPYAVDCTSCDETRVLVGGRCVTRCLEGLFFNVITGRCELCHSTCRACVGSAGRCVSCPKGQGLYDQTHVCHSCCDDGNEIDCCSCDNKTGMCYSPPSSPFPTMVAHGVRRFLSSVSGIISLAIFSCVAFFLVWFGIFSLLQGWCCRSRSAGYRPLAMEFVGYNKARSMHRDNNNDDEDSFSSDSALYEDELLDVAKMRANGHVKVPRKGTFP